MSSVFCGQTSPPPGLRIISPVGFIVTLSAILTALVLPIFKSNVPVARATLPAVSSPVPRFRAGKVGDAVVFTLWLNQSLSVTLAAIVNVLFAAEKVNIPALPSPIVKLSFRIRSLSPPLTFRFKILSAESSSFHRTDSL